MAAQKFMTLLASGRKLVAALQASLGVESAGRIIATNDEGKLDSSFLPTGIGANTTVLPASEALAAGSFVQTFADSGAAKVRLADNSNGRFADGYVKDAVATGANATIYPLDTTNTSVTGLAPGSRYYLGTAGAVISTPLDPDLPANANKVHQYVGYAKSATELVTNDSDYVVL